MSSANNATRPAISFATGINRYAEDVMRYSKHGASIARPFYLTLVVYVILSGAYLAFVDRASIVNFDPYFQRMLPQLVFFFPLILLVGGISGALRRGKHRRKYAVKSLFNSRNVANYLVGVSIIISLMVFLAMFTAVKNTFGDIQGFNHDIWQADLDQLLFFGHDPWRILFTPIHSLPLQQIIEINYNLFWHVQIFAIVAYIAFSDYKTNGRVRYLVCSLLVWAIVGSLFAGLFVSAGPAYYGLVTGDELRFGEQVTALAEYDASTAIAYQAYLWKSYINNVPGFGTGISAFPSIHVSLVILNMLFAFEINKKLGCLAAFYALFVLYSSVYLAWHYAIDGLFGGIIVAIIYYGVRKAMRKDNSELARI